jgi:hypothetical protein
VPNALYADSVYGVWPDTTENFANGVLNVFYSDTLDILVPADAGLVDPAFDGFTIDSVALDDVTNLPPGLSVGCNSQTSAPCTFLSSQLGCGLIEGVPTQAGTYSIELSVTAFTNLAGFVIPVPQTFSGYEITIAENNTSVPSVRSEPTAFRMVPNPASQRATLEFSLPRAAQARVRLYNMVGEEMRSTIIDGRAGLNTLPIDVSALESGVYLYKLQVGGRTSTGRLVVNH